MIRPMINPIIPIPSPHLTRASAGAAQRTRRRAARRVAAARDAPGGGTHETRRGAPGLVWDRSKNGTGSYGIFLLMGERGFDHFDGNTYI